MSATMKAPRAEHRISCGTGLYYWKWKGEREYREHPLVRVFSFRRAKKSISEARTKLQVGKLKVQVARIQHELQKKPVFVNVSSLAPRPFSLLQQVYVVIRQDEGAYVASFSDANINASGETELEAYEMLKDSIVSAFCALSENEADLGVEPQRQLAVLREFIRAK